MTYFSKVMQQRLFSKLFITKISLYNLCVLKPAFVLLFLSDVQPLNSLKKLAVTNNMCDWFMANKVN